MSSENTFLTEEIRQRALGVQSGPAILDVEKGAVARFAEAVGDPSPVFNDEAAARKTRLGTLVAPPTFLRSLRLERPTLPGAPFDRVLDGGSDWEYFEPVRVGDRITGIVRIADLSERSGRLGTMLFMVLEYTYTNQFGERVATQRNTLIYY
jgi:acyl dehydratase